MTDLPRKAVARTARLAALPLGYAGRQALGATLELDVHAGGLRRRAWSPHPDCPCGAGPVDRASQAGGETIMG